MAIAVDGYTKKVKGKTIRVGGYTRSGVAAHALLDRVKDKEHANQLAERYKEFPNTLKLMLDTKWENIKTTKTKIEGGKEVKYTATRRIPMLTAQEWKGLVKENTRAIHTIINNKFYFVNKDLRDDLKAAGQRAIVEAASAYEGKYNPENPADWYRHLYSFARGTMQHELNKLTAGVVDMPYQKKVLFGRFKELWFRHTGDWAKIAADMDLKVKDVNPGVKGEEGEARLPFEYREDKRVTDESVKKKIEAHEQRVNDIQDEYLKSLDMLNDRKAFDNPMAIKEFQAYLLTYDKQISSAKDAMDRAEAGDKKRYQERVKDLETSRAQYEQSFKPIMSKEDYDKEKSVIDNVRQSELRVAKKILDESMTAKTQGATSVTDLFREFETMMDMGEVNLSGDYQSAEGDTMNIEDIVAGGDEADPSDRMSLKEEYKISVERFLTDINKLEARTATVLKMRLGLHEKNKLYAHGLWGEPMTVSEIARNIPKGLYAEAVEKTSVEGGGDVKSYEARLRQWEAAKPQAIEKVKITPAEYEAEQKEYAKRETATKNKWAKMRTAARAKYGADGARKLQIQFFKDAKVSLLDAGLDFRPRKFTERKMSGPNYKKALAAWNAEKPIPTKTRSISVEKRIAKDIELGVMALRRLANVGNVSSMVTAIQAMRRYGIERPDIKASLQKSMIFEQTLGIQYAKRDVLLLEIAKAAKTEVVGAFDGDDIVTKVKSAASRYLNWMRNLVTNK